MKLSVVALDYDGTIADHGSLHPAVRTAGSQRLRTWSAVNVGCIWFLLVGTSCSFAPRRDVGSLPTGSEVSSTARQVRPHGSPTDYAVVIGRPPRGHLHSTPWAMDNQVADVLDSKGLMSCLAVSAYGPFSLDSRANSGRRTAGR